MIAVGNWVPFTITGFGWPGWYEPRNSKYRRHPLDLGLFCDGHVEPSNPDVMPKQTNKVWSSRFEFRPDAHYAKRWNNDNQPHPETWSESMAGVWGE
jgi:hypothetical protein